MHNLQIVVIKDKEKGIWYLRAGRETERQRILKLEHSSVYLNQLCTILLQSIFSILIIDGSPKGKPLFP